MQNGRPLQQVVNCTDPQNQAGVNCKNPKTKIKGTKLDLLT